MERFHCGVDETDLKLVVPEEDEAPQAVKEETGNEAVNDGNEGNSEVQVYPLEISSEEENKDNDEEDDDVVVETRPNAVVLDKVVVDQQDEIRNQMEQLQKKLNLVQVKIAKVNALSEKGDKSKRYKVLPPEQGKRKQNERLKW